MQVTWRLLVARRAVQTSAHAVPQVDDARGEAVLFEEVESQAQVIGEPPSL